MRLRLVLLSVFNEPRMNLSTTSCCSQDGVTHRVCTPEATPAQRLVAVGPLFPRSFVPFTILFL